MIGCRECEKLTSGDCGQHWRVATTMSQQTVPTNERDVERELSLVWNAAIVSDEPGHRAVARRALALIDAARAEGRSEWATVQHAAEMMQNEVDFDNIEVTDQNGEIIDGMLITRAAYDALMAAHDKARRTR